MANRCSSNRATRRAAAVLTAGLFLAPAPLMAQTGSSDGMQPRTVGPLGVTTSFSWDSSYLENVYHSPDRPVSDVVSTLGARTSLGGQVRRLGFTGSASADWVHFDKLASERGANGGASVRLSGLLNRLVPYAVASYRSTRARVNSEIDTRPRMQESTFAVGSTVNLGAKTQLDFLAGRTELGYAHGDTADGVNLAAALNRRTDQLKLSLFEDVTPLTRIGMTADVNRGRFDEASSRSAEHIRLTAAVESTGFLRGSARVGIRILKPSDGHKPISRGLFLAVGTSFSLRDRVQVGLTGERDVTPSYRQDVDYYQQSGFGISLEYAMRPSLQVSAQARRRLADYRALAVSPELGAVLGVEDERSYEAGIRYRFGESMDMGVTGTYTARTSPLATRHFEGLSLGTGVNYAF